MSEPLRWKTAGEQPRPTKLTASRRDRTGMGYRYAVLHFENKGYIGRAYKIKRQDQFLNSCVVFATPPLADMHHAKLVLETYDMLHAGGV